MIIKTPLIVDVAYNNAITKYNPVTKKDDIIVPPDWNVADWNLVKGVICKASQSYISGTYIDITFAHNWRELGRLNKPRSAYHFWSNFRSSGKQAKEFVKIINENGGIQNKDKLVLDAESPGMSISALVDFLYNVEKLTQLKPMIYSRKELLNGLNHRKLTQYQKDYLKTINIWVAGYLNDPDKYSNPFDAGYIPDQSRYGKVVMWQYKSEVPNIGNIPGGMDVNWIDPDFYNDWIGAQTQPVPSNEISDELKMFSNWISLHPELDFFSAKQGWMERSK